MSRHGLLSFAAATALVLTSSVAGYAQGASDKSPGLQMQEKGSVKGTTGASGYAPGHETTGANVKGDADIKAGTTGAKTDFNAGAKVGK